MPGKAPRQKGDRLERLTVDILRSYGLEAKRVPLSGSMRGYKGDVELEVSGSQWRLECKSRKSGFSIEYKALEQGNQAAVIKTDRQEALICMPLRAFGSLMAKVGKDVSRGAHPNEGMLTVPQPTQSTSEILQDLPRSLHETMAQDP